MHCCDVNHLIYVGVGFLEYKKTKNLVKKQIFLPVAPYIKSYGQTSAQLMGTKSVQK